MSRLALQGHYVHEDAQSGRVGGLLTGAITVTRELEAITSEAIGYGGSAIPLSFYPLY